MARIVKILGIIAILALLLGGGALLPVAAAPEVVRGDATQDGVVDVRDLTKVERIIALLD